MLGSDPADYSLISRLPSYVAAGESLIAMNAADGQQRWKHHLEQGALGHGNADLDLPALKLSRNFTQSISRTQRHDLLPTAWTTN